MFPDSGVFSIKDLVSNNSNSSSLWAGEAPLPLLTECSKECLVEIRRWKREKEPRQTKTFRSGRSPSYLYNYRYFVLKKNLTLTKSDVAFSIPDC